MTNVATKAAAMRKDIDATFERLAVARLQLLDAMRLADGEDVA